MYKIIRNDKVVDVVKNPYFVNILPTGNVVISDKSNANGIIGSDDLTIYSFSPNKREDIITATAEKISVEEFNKLKDLLNSNAEVSADISALAEAKQLMIHKLSSICKNKIVAGFSVKLSDGEQHEFKLTTEDQLNLMMIENQFAAGAKTFVYHATNQPCKIFLREDIGKIIEAFKRHTLYHTTYFNAAKHHIKSLTNIEEVNLFTYGDDVSNTIEDIVLRQILKNGGVQE